MIDHVGSPIMSLAMTAAQCQARAAEYETMAVTVAYALDKAHFAEQAARWRRLAAEASRIEEEACRLASQDDAAARLMRRIFGQTATR